jgi:hypothetical protein
MGCEVWPKVRKANIHMEMLLRRSRTTDGRCVLIWNRGSDSIQRQVILDSGVKGD